MRPLWCWWLLCIAHTEKDGPYETETGLRPKTFFWLEVEKLKYLLNSKVGVRMDPMLPSTLTFRFGSRNNFIYQGIIDISHLETKAIDKFLDLKNVLTISNWMWRRHNWDEYLAGRCKVETNHTFGHLDSSVSVDEKLSEDSKSDTVQVK